MDDEQQLLTVREVARRCRRSEETVRRWIWSGKLPARKLGNQLFVPSSELDRLDESRPVYAPAARRKYTKEELLQQIDQDESLANEMLAKYGPTDAAELVRQVREGH